MPDLDSGIRVAIACRVFDHLGCSVGVSNEAKRVLETAGIGDSHPDRVLAAACFLDAKEILALARNAKVDAADILAEADAECWSPFRFRLFLSHVAEHKRRATDLAEALGDFGIQAFVAHKDIRPTREWRNQIRLALRTCNALLALMTPGFHKSDWTDQEIGFVLGLDRLAVAVDEGLPPYGFIADMQGFEGSGKSAAVLAEEIFDAFISNEQIADRMAQAVVSRLMDSDSYASAKRNVALVERLPGKYPALATRLRAAKLTNSQVKDEWNAPTKIDRLCQEWTP